ncbi:hypothetical protein Pcinc_024368 [Petrolisthes cinctipes]|uniref:Uncharacterized protein n=1 Tax=Petrolisthes cinctipes TaxID=88211 RepID=A0AAE1FBJ1_PETCI|nr:hypothetical protein Pcinc_024368 [Petrolisthes cinctipes]
MASEERPPLMDSGTVQSGRSIRGGRGKAENSGERKRMGEILGRGRGWGKFWGEEEEEEEEEEEDSVGGNGEERGTHGEEKGGLLFER